MRNGIVSLAISWNRCRKALGLAAAVVCLLEPAALAANRPSLVKQPVNNNRRVTLKGNIHPLARPRYDYGLASDTLPMNRMLLVLKRSPQQETALDNLLVAQQTKSSSQYHHWITPAQFGKEFGPSDSDIQAVTDWLTSEGFVVNQVSKGRAVIEFSSSAGLVRKALHAEIHQYVVNGKSYWANSTNPQIPAALAPVVEGIASLNNFPLNLDDRVVGLFSRSKTTGKIKSLYTINCPQGYTCTPPTSYALGPTDFATIYNVLPLWKAGIKGDGETIAIVSDSNINTQDVANFRSLFGLPANPVNVILDGPDPGLVPGPETEADADTEWAGAVAPNAKIDLVVSEDTEATAGVDLSALYIVDNDLAPVLSESYGQCESYLGNAGNAFESDMWEQAAAEGITVLVASGDNGSAGCPGTSSYGASRGLAVSGLASTPFNVAVGGTDFDDPSAFFSSTSNSTTKSSAKSYVPEITWNDSCARSGNPADCQNANSSRDTTAGGGGPSNCALQDASGNCTSGYAKPPWQTGTGVPSDGLRDIPDVSLFSGEGFNGAFYIVCSSTGSGFLGGTANCSFSMSSLDFLGVGGTSLSTPAFAGIMALVNQKTGQRQGNANFVLYPLAAAAAKNSNDCASGSSAVNDSSCIFYDIVHGHDFSGNLITPGNNSVECFGGTPDCYEPTGDFNGILSYPANSSTPAWNTSTGYDPATGLGSVNAANLVNNWNSVSFHSSGATLNLSPTTLTHGQSATAGITVTSTAGTPTGDVELMGNPVTTGNPNGSNIGLATFTLGGGGTVSGATDVLPGGAYKVYAHYAGDGTSGSSDSSPVQVTVNPENSNPRISLVTFAPNTGQVSNSNATTVAYGSPYILRVDVLNSAGDACAPSGTPPIACPTGSITLTANGQPLDQGTYALNSLGYTEDQPIQLSGGTYDLVAKYSGDNSYKAATSPDDNVTVTKAVTSAGLSTPGVVRFGTPFTASVSVSAISNGAPPTGTVQIFNGSTPVGSPATCAGSATQGSTFATCTASATLTLNSNTTLTAQYSGDANYAGSTTSAQTVNVVIPTTTTLTVNPSGQVAAGTNVTLTAVVTESQNGGPAPTGNVLFRNNEYQFINGTPTYTATAGTSTTPATLTATLVASFSTWTPVEADYSGDSHYVSSDSASVTVEAGPKPDFSLSVGPANSTVSPGGSATYTITVTPAGGLSGGIPLACTGVPAKANCTISPSAVNIAGTNPQTATVTVTTTAPSLLPPGPIAGPPPPGGFAFQEWWMALLLMIVLGTLAVISRRRRVPQLAGAVLLAALAISCGGGGGGGSSTTPTVPGTPAGTYTLTISGTSGSLSHTSTVTLTVR